jgi:diaminopimelate epimerase
MVTIRGNATFLYDASIEVDPAGAAAEPPLVHARREDEAEAWAAAIPA